MASGLSTLDVRESHAHASTVIAALQRRHIEAHYLADRTSAWAAIVARIPHGASIFCSDAPILDELGGIAQLRGGDTIGHDARFRAGVYLTSVDALTSDGRVLCRDASAHRLAPVLFGPAKVLIVLGTESVLEGGPLPAGMGDYSFLLRGAPARPGGRVSFLLVGPR